MIRSQTVQVAALGQRPDSSKVRSQTAYLAHAGRVSHTVIYAGRLRPETVDGFFGGLRLQ